MTTSTEIKKWEQRVSKEDGGYCSLQLESHFKSEEIIELRAALESSHQALRQITYEGPSTAVRIATQALAGVVSQDSGRDAERFVFEHSNPEAMLKIELKAIQQEPAPLIDWWRIEIDAAMAAQQGKKD